MTLIQCLTPSLWVIRTAKIITCVKALMEAEAKLKISSHAAPSETPDVLNAHARRQMLRWSSGPEDEDGDG